MKSDAAKVILVFLFWPLFILLTAYVGVWGAIAVCATVCITVGVVKKVKDSAHRQGRCLHGVNGGETGGCIKCAEEQASRRSKWVIEEAERARRSDLQKKAIAFRNQQINELWRQFLSRSDSYLAMTPQQFENAIATLFQQLGYEVKQTPYSNDRGKDAILSKEGKKYLLECKRYASGSTVGRRDLQIFVAAMKEEKALGGFYINTGQFARTCSEYATANKIELYDRRKLAELINSAFGLPEAALAITVMCQECGELEQLPIAECQTIGQCKNGHAIQNDVTANFVRNLSYGTAPLCDRCGAPLRVVNGYRRYRATFWRCSSYPRCFGKKQFTEEDRLQLKIRQLRHAEENRK